MRAWEMGDRYKDDPATPQGHTDQTPGNGGQANNWLCSPDHAEMSPPHEGCTRRPCVPALQRRKLPDRAALQQNRFRVSPSGGVCVCQVVVLDCPHRLLALHGGLPLAFPRHQSGVEDRHRLGTWGHGRLSLFSLRQERRTLRAADILE